MFFKVILIAAAVTANVVLKTELFSLMIHHFNVILDEWNKTFEIGRISFLSVSFATRVISENTLVLFCAVLDLRLLKDKICF